MGDITENFSRSEFACKCGCGFDQINIGLIHRLQVIRDILGVPIQVLSGCRCKKHNADPLVGGEPDSYHLTGEAADWTVSEILDIAEALSHWSGGFHYYPDKVFIHTDVGPRRRW